MHSTSSYLNTFKKTLWTSNDYTFSKYERENFEQTIFATFGPDSRVVHWLPTAFCHVEAPQKCMRQPNNVPFHAHCILPLPAPPPVSGE